nr:homolog of EHV2 ORF34 protein UL95 [Macronycteris gammaherpesvirus 1]
MFNLTSMASNGDQDLGKKYFDSVSLSTRLCENVPNQFKLIETPINSFLLVSNVMPNDTRPWSDHNPNGFDFTGIHLPRLQKLNTLTNWNATASQKCQPDNKEPSYSAPHYIVYDSWSWRRALKINKDEVIKEAVSQFANPVNWQGVAVEDPLPLLWLLFYGKKSFCDSEECLFFNAFKHPGPILWPKLLYKPTENIQSFMAYACKYVRFLYGCGFKEDDLTPNFSFNIGRITDALDKMRFIEDSGTYVSRTCLPCHLYKQNLVSRGEVSYSLASSIILAGSGKKYMTSNIGTKRCLDLGDTVLYPSYDIQLLLSDLTPDGII